MHKNEFNKMDYKSKKTCVLQLLIRLPNMLSDMCAWTLLRKCYRQLSTLDISWHSALSTNHLTADKTKCKSQDDHKIT